MISCVIIDDEKPARDSLELMLEYYFSGKVRILGATADWRRPGWRRLYPAHTLLPAGVASFLLADGLQLRHTRYRRRRILHAGTRRFTAILLRGDPQHLLPPGFHYGTGTIDHPGRVPGKIDRQNPLCLEHQLLYSRRSLPAFFLCIIALYCPTRPPIPARQPLRPRR